ncbi:Plant invertase/pectin methylesterase inhibitor superfamily protein [Hibiscus syriacus]|uniref:Plant invertase/pectin methylesterase inhibitor superfamily protein n=1 Tax=Hibiscus syriacus TaxID=106335 RepID=A0A6A3CML2_HIBSY|nr:Plant invertase/pectin methylesterase inhibitor superfamily protein [Hibiscus syriacus]
MWDSHRNGIHIPPFGYFVNGANSVYITSCAQTRYPDVTLNQAVRAHQLSSSIDSSSFNDRAKLAWNDCLEFYEDTVHHLNQSTSTNNPMDSQTWVSASKADIVVAQDGSGNFKTITEAVAAAGGAKELKNAQTTTTFRSATVGVSGDGFVARDITFENTAGPQKHQAMNLRSSSDFSVFYRCSFKELQHIHPETDERPKEHRHSTRENRPRREYWHNHPHLMCDSVIRYEGGSRFIQELSWEAMAEIFENRVHEEYIGCVGK